MTPLFGASECGHLEVVRELLAYGAAVGTSSIDGSTPLHLASAVGHLEVVRELLARGASHAALDINGHTALSMAITYRNPATQAIVHLLFAAEAV
jgi:ankyrin repeat protein